MVHDIPLILAAGLYLAAAALLYRSLASESANWRSVSLTAAIAGVVLHVAEQYNHWIAHPQPDVSVASLLSLCALAVIVILVISAFTRHSLYDAGLVALPIAAVVSLVEWMVPPGTLSMSHHSTGTTVHLVSSVLAFGLLSIAGVYALFVYIIDYFLRRHHLNPLVRSLPPLEILETLLFRLIVPGFLLLTLSLASGLVFINDIFAQHLVHKTALSLLAWVVFGVLLWGRWRYGWRGSLAVRLTLAGVILMVLSYFGSKLVLEVILGRNWQT
jgi:ABC-type uncharacterized transport system permease subunit